MYIIIYKHLLLQFLYLVVFSLQLRICNRILEKRVLVDRMLSVFSFKQTVSAHFRIDYVNTTAGLNLCVFWLLISVWFCPHFPGPRFLTWKYSWWRETTTLYTLMPFCPHFLPKVALLFYTLNDMLYCCIVVYSELTQI